MAPPYRGELCSVLVGVRNQTPEPRVRWLASGWAKVLVRRLRISEQLNLCSPQAFPESGQAAVQIINDRALGGAFTRTNYF